MSVDSSNWMAKKIVFYNITYHLWLNILRHVLCPPTNGVIWHRDFQNNFLYPSPNVIFTILKHVGKLTNAAVLCDFIFIATISAMAYLVSWALSETIVILVRRLAWRVWSAISLLKILSSFLAKMWVLYVKVSFQPTWKHSLVCQFLTTNNTLRTWVLSSDEINS
jgi:hypothetical protein